MILSEISKTAENKNQQQMHTEKCFSILSHTKEFRVTMVLAMSRTVEKKQNSFSTEAKVLCYIYKSCSENICRYQNSCFRGTKNLGNGCKIQKMMTLILAKNIHQKQFHS